MEKLWTRSFIQLTLAMFFLFVGFYLLIPTLPIYVKEIGGSEASVGLIMGVFTLAAVIARLLVGGLLDRYGRKVFILFGLLFFTVTMFIYHWAATVVLLIVIRLIHGLSWGVTTTSIGTAVTDVIPERRRGEGMGWYGMAVTIAMAISPLIAVIIVQNYSFSSLFSVATALSVIALLLAWKTNIPFVKQAERENIVFFERSLIPISLALFFLTFTYGGIMTFLPLFVETINVNAGTFFLVYALSLTAVRPIAGKLADKKGEVIVVIPAFFILIAALIVLSFSKGLIGIVVTAILYGIGFGAAQPVLQAQTINLVSPNKRGVANASFFTAFDLGIGLGSIALGLFSKSLGYEQLFFVCALFALLSFLIYLFFVKKQRTVSTEHEPS